HFPAKRDNRRPDGESKTASIASQYPVLWDLKKHFLDDALSLLGQEDPLSLEGVYEELAWIANKLIVAHGMDLTSEDKMKWAVQRTRALVNLGLEVLSQKDFPQAVSLLKTRWVETVFRYGIYELFLLRDGAKKIVSKYWENKPEIFRDFLSLPYDFIMTGLLENIPRHYDFESIDNLEHLRDFHNSEDLTRARQSLDQISNIHNFIARSDPSAFPRLVKPAFRNGCNLYSALGTFFVRTVLDMKRSLEPLSLAAIRDFRDKAFDETGRLFRPEAKESFFNACFSADEQVLLRPLWGLVFQSVLDSMPALDLEKSRVLGTVEGFLVKPESPLAKKKKPAAAKRGKSAKRSSASR
ncbi:MAG TPA: DUF6178 family protein, partial [Verrucomicrobiae bacterium]|nr:DUF6178 family protein [Verrucomicrobiae bacterium]